MLRTAVLWCLLAFWVTGGHQLTAKNKTTIVELHNRFRSHVVPSAENMRRVHWNESLAAIAAAYVTKCVWDHNSELEDIGENLYITSGSLNVSNSIVDWYEEHLDYTYKNNSCQEDKMCGHYTQVVWADTYAVGCAAHLCDTVEGIPFEKANLFICNYYPPGNFRGIWPYAEGKPCSRCPIAMPLCKGDLCEAVEKLTSTTQSTSSSTATTKRMVTMHWTTSRPALETTRGAKDRGACAVTGASLTVLFSALLLLLTI